jgi:hypothetical protein
MKRLWILEPTADTTADARLILLGAVGFPSFVQREPYESLDVRADRAPYRVIRRHARLPGILNKAAVDTARRLTESPEGAARWVGRDALRDLTNPTVRRQLATRRRRTATTS